MPATTAAAVSPAQMVFGLEYNETTIIEIEVAGPRRLMPDTGRPAPECGNAILADARTIPHLRRHLRKQLIRNLRLHAPTGALVSSGGAKLATVCLPAERAPLRIAS